ncbi:MAG: hypothetical protein EXS37_03670 [Opitutus sp.]|nr:hypothetical protein [Opitutus sp.]
MPLTSETRRPWLLLPVAWGVCAWLIVAHAQGVREYLRSIEDIGRRPGPALVSPTPHLMPANCADTQMWVHHALSLGEGGTRRVRFTHVDNAPFGREVHWSTPFTWIVATGGAVRGAFTGESRRDALDGALPWINAPLLFGSLIIFSWWIARRFGPAIGAVVALGFVGHTHLYVGFEPLNVDHHGLLAVALLGLLLGVGFMGLGWQQEGHPLLPAGRATARRAAIFSAVCGAVGLWISAASTLPGIGIAGAAGLAATWWTGPSPARADATFEAGLWRLWGRVGGGLSLLFYLFEYAPSHLGWRLEVNHPLYAAAWWGGAELVAGLADWGLARGSGRPFLWRPLVLPALAIAAPPVAILAGGTAVFGLSDPFVADLRHLVIEGQTLFAVGRNFGFSVLRHHFASCAILVAGAIALWRTRDAATRLLVAFLTVATTAFVAMGFAEVRWWPNAGAAQLVLLVVLLAALRDGTRRWARPVALGGFTLLFLGLGALRVLSAHLDREHRLVRTGEVSQLLYRDLAVSLRTAQPEGDIVVLADPNASIGLSHYGQMLAIGTLYWENVAGLKAAAEIFCTDADATAADLVRARGITHVVVIRGDSFLTGFFRLLRPEASPENIRRTFGYRIATQPDAAPAWLQPMPYRRLAELGPIAETVVVFKVAFNQTEPERLFHVARAQLARDAVAAAEGSIGRALELTSATAQARMCTEAAAAFYDYGADAAAARLFQRSLTLEPDPITANTLAWILATTSDASVRNGRAALALVEPLIGREPVDSAVLSTYAAACGELGRFPAAIDAAERALSAARAAHDTEAEPLLLRRLATYRANRPWRQ